MQAIIRNYKGLKILLFVKCEVFLIRAKRGWFKWNSKDTRSRPCSKLTIKTLEQFVKCSMLTIKITERRQWRLSGVFIVNFENISQIVVVFLFLTLRK